MSVAASTLVAMNASVPDGAAIEMLAGSTRQPLDAEWLTERYVDDRLSTDQIAQLCGWSSQYVRDRLRDFGIPLRGTGNRAHLHLKLDRETVESLLQQGLSAKQISQRSGYSTSGVHLVLRRLGLTVPPPAVSADHARTDPVIADIVRLYRDERQSLATIAQRFHHDPDWVKVRLRRAGIPLRPPGRQQQVDHQRVRELLDTGLRVQQIAERLHCSETTVLGVLRQQGWSGPPPRPRGPNRNRPAPPDPVVLRRLYVTEGLSIAATADRLAVTPAAVRAALGDAGIPVTRPGWATGRPPPPIGEEQLRELYIDRQLSTRQVADLLHCTPTRVLNALRRFAIAIDPHRQDAIPPLHIDRSTMVDLYVTRRLGDAAIARQYGVPTWRVTHLRRNLDVHRPPVPRPRRPKPAPPPAELRRLYVGEHRTLEQIARQHHTSSPVVRSWLQAAGIPVQPRTTRATRTQLDPVLVAELYQEREWDSPQIAALLDTTVQLVLRTLHEHDIPVRPGGRPARDAHPPFIDPRLTALYADPEIDDLLKRHDLPRREQPGSITDRFPTAAPITEPFLREAYVQIGLAATHIEMLTGQSTERVFAELHGHGIPVRSAASFSPWFLRHRSGS
jgi:AraC-like DNA-binding protein